MEVIEMTDVTSDVIQAFQLLIPQLTDHKAPPNEDALRRMANSQSVIVFLARDPDLNDRIVGSAVLVAYETPTGLHGWIEDVVVDQAARGKGFGGVLTEACLGKARALGLKAVNLTSRPSRKAANRLYQKMGFQPRETNVYEYRLD